MGKAAELAALRVFELTEQLAEANARDKQWSMAWAEYSGAYQLKGASHIETGRAWDALYRLGVDSIRKKALGDGEG